MILQWMSMSVAHVVPSVPHFCILCSSYGLKGTWKHPIQSLDLFLLYDGFSIKKNIINFVEDHQMNIPPIRYKGVKMGSTPKIVNLNFKFIVFFLDAL
jgi:hypothetical protein